MTMTERTGCPSQFVKMPLERSIIPVVEGMFREGARHHEPQPGVDAELLATTAAWAIFGAARRSADPARSALGTMKNL